MYNHYLQKIEEYFDEHEWAQGVPAGFAMRSVKDTLHEQADWIIGTAEPRNPTNQKGDRC